MIYSSQDELRYNKHHMVTNADLIRMQIAYYIVLIDYKQPGANNFLVSREYLEYQIFRHTMSGI